MAWRSDLSEEVEDSRVPALISGKKAWRLSLHSSPAIAVGNNRGPLVIENPVSKDVIGMVVSVKKNHLFWVGFPCFSHYLNRGTIVEA